MISLKVAFALFGIAAGIFLWHRAIVMGREAQGRGYYDGTLEAYYGSVCLILGALMGLMVYGDVTR